MKRYIRYDNSTAGSFREVQEVESLPGDPYNLPLTLVGDGTGENNLVGNYSGAATDFFYAPDPGEVFVWTSFLIQISDNAKFIQTGYGGGTALINGIKFFVGVNGIEIPLLGGMAIKKNSDWFSVTKDATLTNFNGVADTLVVFFSLTDDFDSHIILDNRQAAKIFVRLNDDFTGLVDHKFTARGRLYTL